MKILRQFIFTVFAVAGLTLAVSAQKNDPKKPPPKAPPPKIVPGGDKKPPPPPPRGKGPKKPGEAFFLALKEPETEVI